MSDTFEAAADEVSPKDGDTVVLGDAKGHVVDEKGVLTVVWDDNILDHVEVRNPVVWVEAAPGLSFAAVAGIVVARFDQGDPKTPRHLVVSDALELVNGKAPTWRYASEVEALLQGR